MLVHTVDIVTAFDWTKVSDRLGTRRLGKNILTAVFCTVFFIPQTVRCCTDRRPGGCWQARPVLGCSDTERWEVSETFACRSSPYCAVNTHLLHCRGKSCCLFWDPQETRKCWMWDSFCHCLWCLKLPPWFKGLYAPYKHLWTTSYMEQNHFQNMWK